ncbi:protein FAM76A [Sitophilus oryzae]|uniref:Protein FAM76A n=1 Tax=Sitophilus oryzae TaxID=7048 RepID=A0A6J2XQF5_SITOR|nr:protein FAM76A [Sitophilus oryzae]XP_030753613.1 protein FAM76A [Sitophilus oryzae]XP_030753614.1 protein FAM76A [Sitophilus oryzae]
MSAPLFACSRCFARYPFEELSAGQQLCKECRGAFPVVKCTYCRSEFQQTSKGSTSAICKKCEQNVKAYGKPTACEYCNIIAAFIGNKCQRCTNSEIKYGPPVNCEQCKQKCAFDRQDDDKKVDGKLLCWLCTLSFKRALAKTKQGDAERRAQLKMSQIHKKHKDGKLRGHNKRPNRPDVTKMPVPDEQPPNKVARNNTAPGMVRTDLDPNSSDHVVAMTQLKEQIASLKKQITQKDSQLLGKDKMITELKAKHFTTESELRVKMKTSLKEHEDKVDTLNKRISGLLKQVAGLSKTAKKGLKGDLTVTSDANNSSGTDSPSIQ